MIQPGKLYKASPEAGTILFKGRLQSPTSSNTVSIKAGEMVLCVRWARWEDDDPAFWNGGVHVLGWFVGLYQERLWLCIASHFTETPVEEKNEKNDH